MHSVLKKNLIRCYLRPNNISIFALLFDIKTFIFDKEFTALYANFMDRLRCSDFIHPRYMLYILTAFYQNGFVWNYIKQTTGIQNLDITSMLFKEKVVFPDMEEQNEIISYL